MTGPDNPLKIAIVSDYYFDYVGGAQTSMRQQKLALERAGHTVLIISPARGIGGARYQRTADGLQVRPLFRLPALDLAVMPNTARSVGVLEEYLRAERVDIVHVQTEFGLAHTATGAAASIGIPLIHTVHSLYWASEGTPQASVAWFIRWALGRVIGTRIPNILFTPRPTDNVLRNLVIAMARRSKQVVSPSKHQAEDLAAAGVAGNISVIPNPISTMDVESNTLTIEQARRPNFLWVARCEPVKRPLHFARAVIIALARTNNGFSVDFVGEGSDFAALKKLATDHPEITVHGALPHDDVLALMDASAAIALTSLGFDNQPMTIAEAVSRERGVLYCDPKLTEGLLHSGYRSQTADDAGLADAIVALVEDPSLLVTLSRGALIDRELFSPTNYADRIVEVYRR
ncbi:glycosyltransferase family 4 protein [Frigoribacterium sp. CG_9.8]|uniref:glycosyltransferase family 4 protein n=1 Tax=Frigoribacterium sp. CG_9.8 TaxID=2787733 RepID=UPI0018CA1CB7|nr:glycosyltransferase family 4 protein [Frigoribacterium sp. CG_9.8]MBG6107972.1 glycosyltransferase involved in cell wall biosynthesis [Frigoribacterium sp. CG_9.8]